MLASPRRAKSTINIWPGYVDALSALLMLVIFTLLVFTLAQVFLSEILSNQDRELSDLNARLAEISSLLGLEQEKSRRLDNEVKQISEEYSRSLEKQYELFGQVEKLTTLSQADREKIELQLRSIASLQQDIDSLQQMRQKLEQEVGNLVLSLEGRDQQLGALQAQSEDLKVQLSDKEMQIGALRDRSKSLQARLADEAERTLLAQQTIEQKEIRIEELVAVVNAGNEALDEEKELSTQARAQVELLNRQIAALREQLLVIGQALKLAEEKNADQEVQLTDIGKRLNTLLAERVNKLERYRSEFFGRLREALGENPDIRVVGDRFVLPSELLFASGSATLGEAGRSELFTLAATLRQIAGKIPSDVNWILRVDGHTDRRPIQTEQFPSNWELSTARAVSVVRFLAQQGIPQQRMAATGFGEFHPVESADTPEAFQRNRRIEIKLTDR